MIEKIDNIDKVLNFYSDDIYSVRIKSLISAYNTKYDFALFYRQVIDDETTAIISQLDNDVTLSFSSTADLVEINAFLKSLKLTSLLCDSKFDFDGREYDEGIVMVSTKSYDVDLSYSEIDEYPRLMDLFNFIDYEQQDFESWYVDINHRIRHNAAKAFSLNINDEIVSSALFSSIYEDYAVMTSVRTKSEFRRMGYGSSLIKAMISDYGKTVYIMREEDKNEKFYKGLGFADIGKWRMYK